MKRKKKFVDEASSVEYVLSFFFLIMKMMSHCFTINLCRNVDLSIFLNFRCFEAGGLVRYFNQKTWSLNNFYRDICCSDAIVCKIKYNWRAEWSKLRFSFFLNKNLETSRCVFKWFSSSRVFDALQVKALCVWMVGLMFTFSIWFFHSGREVLA